MTSAGICSASHTRVGGMARTHFADARVPDQEQLEEVVVSVRHGSKKAARVSDNTASVCRCRRQTAREKEYGTKAFCGQLTETPEHSFPSHAVCDDAGVSAAS